MKNLTFIPYEKAHQIGTCELIVCDCYYPRGLNLTHLYSERVPAQYRSNTSTETTIKWLSDPSLDKPASEAAFVTCNHWDIDGFLSVWASLNPELAISNKALLIAAAHLGDFREFDPNSTEGLNALKICCLLNTLEAQEFCLPFGVLDDATIEYQVSVHKFEYFLLRFSQWLQDIDSFKPLWENEYNEVLDDLRYISSSAVAITENDVICSSIITTPRALHYYASFSCIKGSIVITELTSAEYVELEYRYETSVGRLDKIMVDRKDLTPIAIQLCTLESNPEIEWVFDNINEGGPTLRPQIKGSIVSREQRYQSMCRRKDGFVRTSITPDTILRLVEALYKLSKK